MGVKVLYRSLRKSGTTRPLVVMVTENIDVSIRDQLESLGCLIREVPNIGPNPGLQHSYARVHYADVWSKLGVWNLTEFSRLVFLDADMLVIENMDELFDVSLPVNGIAACYGCRCNFDKVASYPDNWCPQICFYTWCEDDKMTAHPPASLDNYLNAGLLVLIPDSNVYTDMLERLAAISDMSKYFFPEQDFLNEYYRDSWLPLHYGYNAMKALSYQHSNMWNMQRVKNVHYIGEKPWNTKLKPEDKYYELHNLWWKFNQE